MVSDGITKDGMSKSKVDLCEVCSLRVIAVGGCEAAVTAKTGCGGLSLGSVGSCYVA